MWTGKVYSFMQDNHWISFGHVTVIHPIRLLGYKVEILLEFEVRVKFEMGGTSQSKNVLGCFFVLVSTSLKIETFFRESLTIESDRFRENRRFFENINLCDLSGGREN